MCLRGLNRRLTSELADGSNFFTPGIDCSESYATFTVLHIKAWAQSMESCHSRNFRSLPHPAWPPSSPEGISCQAASNHLLCSSRTQRFSITNNLSPHFAEWCSAEVLDLYSEGLLAILTFRDFTKSLLTACGVILKYSMTASLHFFTYSLFIITFLSQENVI